jgi:hypothetical protein
MRRAWPSASARRTSPKPGAEEGNCVPEPEIHKPWPRPWTWAIVLAVLLLGAQATARWWGPALVQVLSGGITTPADAPPFLWALLVGWVILSLTGGRSSAR